MLLINKNEIMDVINVCLQGEYKGYYKLFVWHSEVHNFRVTFKGCLEQIRPILDVLLTQRNADAHCLNALPLIKHPDEQDKIVVRARGGQHVNPTQAEIEKIEDTLKSGVEQGHGPSCYLQALIYLTQKEPEESIRNHTLLNLLHVPYQYFAPSAYLLAISVYSDRPEDTETLLQGAAEQGFLPAMSQLAQNYQENIYSLAEKDKALRQFQMFYWYEKAAREGDASSITSLVRCYTQGKGTERNFVEAAYWIQQGSTIRGNEENISLWYETTPEAFHDMLSLYKLTHIRLPYMDASDDLESISSFDYPSYFRVIQQFPFITAVTFMRYEEIYSNAPDIAPEIMQELHSFLAANRQRKQQALLEQPVGNKNERNQFLANLSQDGRQIKKVNSTLDSVSTEEIPSTRRRSYSH